MSLSRQSLEILHDILEIKINDLQVQDRDDARELNKLRKCRQELMGEINGRNSRASSRLFQERPRRTRRTTTTRRREPLT